MASPTDKTGAHKPRRGIIIFAAFLLLSLILTWPLAAHPTTHLPFGGDAFQTIWDFHWLKKCFSEGLNPFYTTLMFAPEGTSLALHDMTWLNSVPAVVLQMVLGNRILVFNILWLLALTLSGYFMYLYARRHLGDGIPAFGAGCLFAYSTYHLHHGAQLGSMWIGWLPLFQLYIESALEPKGPWKNAAKAGAVLAAAGYSHWYLAAFCLFQLFFTLIWTLIVSRPFNRGAIWRAVIIAVAGTILLLPILIPAVQESRGIENVHLKIEQRESYGADMAAFILPSPRHPVFGETVRLPYARIKGSITESPIYPGWILWLLVLTALVSRTPDRGRLLFLSLCFIILSLGTKPHFLGTSAGIPMPYALFEHIPGLDFIRVPARFMAAAMLFLSLMAGHGLALLCSKLRNPKIGIGAAILIICLALFDTTILPMPTRDTSAHSEFYTELAKDESDALILDYPVHTYQEYIYFQTIHGKPIISGYGVYLPQDRLEWIIGLNDEPWKARALGVRYIIFHRGYANPSPKGTITIGGNELPPDIYFEKASGYQLIHEDRYIKVYNISGS